MKRTVYLVSALLTLSFLSAGQSSRQTVFTTDIDNFWRAFDSIQTTKDSVQQVRIIQTLYIDKGTDGLKAFMEAREYTAELWVDLIRKYPRFWRSIRPNTLAVRSKANEIEKS